MKILLTLLLIFVTSVFNFVFAELKFNPIAINENNNYLFNTREIIGNKEYNRTLFYGSYENEAVDFKAVSFYPEKMFYSQNDRKLFIFNRTGLFEYDFNANTAKSIDNYPNFSKNNEYSIYSPSEVSFSPDYNYFIAKIPSSNLKASIYLVDLKNNKSAEVIKDIDVKPEKKTGLWSNDSNYFIYEKGNKIFYFSIADFNRGKILSEEWREIGKINLTNCQWTEDNYLYWIEKNYIYIADSNQFFSRAIYKNYLRQGSIVKNIPFGFDPAFDNFYVNDKAKRFIIVKNKNTLFYYSLNSKINEYLYLPLGENHQIEKSVILDNGEALILTGKIDNGKYLKEIFLIKRVNGILSFQNFDGSKINNNMINNVFFSNDKSEFVVATDKGAFSFNFSYLGKNWAYQKEKILYAVNTQGNEWVLGGDNTISLITSADNKVKPILASSFKKAGFAEDKIFVRLNDQSYLISSEKLTLSLYDKDDSVINVKDSNSKYRLMSREINKGFYQDSIYLKDLYSGKYIDIAGEPKLKYTLYQPELKMGASYYNSPLKEKYEIALVFNCTRSAEGVIDILKTLNDFSITSTFFINGIFMDINPVLTKEISSFQHEIGNIFQYDINLTDTNFLIDNNFIRQGLSSNEEKFNKLTGKNFSPIWHSPSYAFNGEIIKYGKESGYSFVTYNMDSLDWVGDNNIELSKTLFMKNSELIDRIMKNVKPGQIIIFNVGKNENMRSEWLFQDLKLLLSELVRSGYSFASATEILKKYKN